MLGTLGYGLDGVGIGASEGYIGGTGIPCPGLGGYGAEWVGTLGTGAVGCGPRPSWDEIVIL
jgi:hypothetical protein